MKLSTADGRKLTYRCLGAGPVVVCHPGGPGFSSTYMGDLAGLGKRFTLVILNPRGTADSDRPADPGAYHLADYVSDLDELRQHLRLEAMALLGYSHGGVVAQAYALSHPGRVSRLVLASTAARFGAEQEAATLAAKEKRADQSWYPDAVAASNQDAEMATDERIRIDLFRVMPFYFARFGQVEADYIDTFRSEAINGDALRVFGEEIPNLDLRRKLGGVRIPTLVITGDDDFICGPVCAAEIGAAIPGARVVIVPNAGHMVFMEQPQAFHDGIANFLGTA